VFIANSRSGPGRTNFIKRVARFSWRCKVKGTDWSIAVEDQCHPAMDLLGENGRRRSAGSSDRGIAWEHDKTLPQRQRHNEIGARYGMLDQNGGVVLEQVAVGASTEFRDRKDM
jgi:hypothetical protein